MTSSATQTPSAVTDHPAWCDADHCETQAGVVHHRSRPIRWRIDGGDAEIVACRSQYDTRKPIEPGYQIQICRYDVAGEHVAVEWTGNDTRFLLVVLDQLSSLY
jgi:hypothetical protein